MPHQVLKTSSIGIFNDLNDDGSVGSLMKGLDHDFLASATKSERDGEIELNARSQSRDPSANRSPDKHVNNLTTYRRVKKRSKNRIPKIDH